MNNKLFRLLGLFFISSNVLAVAPAQVPATGETGSKGVAWPMQRFVADANGDCITDRLTGLMWPKNGIIGFIASYDGDPIAQPNYANTSASLNKITWGKALTAVANMNNASTKLCGYSDWRLPNKVELKSLINYGAANPANWLMYGTGTSSSPVCNNNTCFTNVQAAKDSSPYWSSSSYAPDTSAAWLVYFFDGNVSVGMKIGGFYVWPVRGGQ